MRGEGYFIPNLVITAMDSMQLIPQTKLIKISQDQLDHRAENNRELRLTLSQALSPTDLIFFREKKRKKKKSHSCSD